MVLVTASGIRAGRRRVFAFTFFGKRGEDFGELTSQARRVAEGLFLRGTGLTEEEASGELHIVDYVDASVVVNSGKGTTSWLVSTLKGYEKVVRDAKEGTIRYRAGGKEEREVVLRRGKGGVEVTGDAGAMDRLRWVVETASSPKDAGDMLVEMHGLYKFRLNTTGYRWWRLPDFPDNIRQLISIGGELARKIKNSSTSSK